MNRNQSRDGCRKRQGGERRRVGYPLRWVKPKQLTVPNSGKDVEPLGFLYIAGGRRIKEEKFWITL